jgi:hypothetical protein
LAEKLIKKTMNELKQLITQHYPMSDNAWDVFQTSQQSFFDRTNTMLDYNSVDPGTVPVFLSKLLNRLETAGITIESLDDPFHEQTKRGVPTFKVSYHFGSVLDGLPIKYVDEEIMSVTIDDVVNYVKEKTDKIAIYSITPEINKSEYKFNIYIRGII